MEAEIITYNNSSDKIHVHEPLMYQWTPKNQALVKNLTRRDGFRFSKALGALLYLGSKFFNA